VRDCLFLFGAKDSMVSQTSFFERKRDVSTSVDQE
jgi:hypothetical protein